MTTETLGMAEGSRRFGGSEGQERLPQCFFAAAVLGGEQEERMTIKLCGYGLALLLQLPALEFVTFGRHDHKRALVIGQEFTERRFLFFQPATNIHNDDHRPQMVRVNEIVLNQLLPLPPFLFGNLSITVAGQIDEGEFLVDDKEIELSGPPGGRADAGNRTVEQPVNERGFPDVRATGKSNFRVWQFGISSRLGCRTGEFNCRDFHEKLSRM